MSHSIHILNIQIDTKILILLTITSTVSNCPFLQANPSYSLVKSQANLVTFEIRKFSFSLGTLKLA